MKKQLWGLGFLFLSVLVILHYFKVVPNIPLMLIIVTVFLLNWLIKSIMGRNLFGVFTSCVAGFLFYNHEFKFVDIPYWTVILSAVLAYVGITMIFEQYKPKKVYYHAKFQNESIIDGDDFEEVRDGMYDEKAHSVSRTSFSSSTKYVHTNNVDGMSFSCSFGESKVFFDDAKIRDSQAKIHVTVSFGEMTLFIPKNWQVINNVTVFLGEVTQAQNILAYEKTLMIDGNVQFGELNIVYI
ncbi:hypothetical protein KG091_02155 [Carnobacteriaceae bacterium zg-ZUI78]|nr:hypothetical protein [Carnobacteriaceae bacterium zg-ZUI78]